MFQDSLLRFEFLLLVARVFESSDRKFVTVIADLLGSDREGFGGAIVKFSFPTAEFRPSICTERQVIIDDKLAFIVERVAVGLHIDEQHVLGRTTFRED